MDSRYFRKVYGMFADILNPTKFKTHERGSLTFLLDNEQKESAIKLSDGYICIDEKQVGIYNKNGEFICNELGALEKALETNNLDLIEYLDAIVPIENERYTTYSFAAKTALRGGLDYGRCTYLMRDDSGLIKIGMAKSPLKRQEQLKRDFPSIKIVAICPYYCERELHLLFHGKRVMRNMGYGCRSVEWFNLTDEDIKYIYRNYNFTKYDRQSE